MKLQRDNYINFLTKIIKENNTNNKVNDYIKSEMLKRGVSIGRTQGILNLNVALESMPDDVLYLLNKYYYEKLNPKAFDKNKLNPLNYFYEPEIEKAELYRIDNSKNKKEDYIDIENVLKTNDNQYIAVIPIQEIARWFNEIRIRYNPETQRAKKVVEYKGTIIEKIDINEKSVREIKFEIEDRSFKSNVITFNSLREQRLEFEYDEEGKILMIEGMLDILDGFHRCCAIQRVLRDNPSFEMNMEVRFTHFNMAEAQDFIVQEDKRNPIKASRKAFLNNKNFDNLAVKRLNELDGEMKNGIASDSSAYRNNQAYCMFDTMLLAIKNNFDIEKKIMADDVAEWLCEGFDRIIGELDINIDDLSDIRKKSAIMDDRMFIGYVALLKELEGERNWKKILRNVLSSLDFSRDNELWEELNIISKLKLTKPIVQHISEYFIDLVAEKMQEVG